MEERKEGWRAAKIKEAAPWKDSLADYRNGKCPVFKEKFDELQATVHVHHAYRKECILAFTETWLKTQDSDSALTINRFGTPLRTDRDSLITCKSQGGGVCLYIHKRWCNSVILRETLCTQDIELLSVSL